MLAVNQKGDVILIWKKNSASAAINLQNIIPTPQSRSDVTMWKGQGNCVRSVSTNFTRCLVLYGVTWVVDWISCREVKKIAAIIPNKL